VPLVAHARFFLTPCPFYIFCVAINRISYDGFSAETIELVNQILLTNSTLGKLLFNMKLEVNLTDFLSGIKYLETKYAKQTYGRQLSLIFLKYLAFGVTVPYFCIWIFFMDEIAYIFIGASRYFEFDGKTVRLVIFLLTQPIIHWDMFCFIRFTTFSLIYVYFVVNFWLQQCW